MKKQIKQRFDAPTFFGKIIIDITIPLFTILHACIFGNTIGTELEEQGNPERNVETQKTRLGRNINFGTNT